MHGLFRQDQIRLAIYVALLKTRQTYYHLPMSQTNPPNNINTNGGTFVGSGVNTGGGKFVGRDEITHVFTLPNSDDLLNWLLQTAKQYQSQVKESNPEDQDMLQTVAAATLLLRGQAADTTGLHVLNQVRALLATVIAAEGPKFTRVSADATDRVVPVLLGQAICAVFLSAHKPTGWDAALKQLTSPALIDEIAALVQDRGDQSAAWLGIEIEQRMAHETHRAACAHLLADLSDPAQGLPVVAHLLTLRDGQRPSGIVNPQTLLIAIVAGAAGASLLIGGIAVALWVGQVLRIDVSTAGSNSLNLVSAPEGQPQPPGLADQPPQQAAPPPEQKSSSGGRRYSPDHRLPMPPTNTRLPYIVKLADLSPNRNLPPILAQMEFCFVPEGNFLMGTLQNDPDAWNDSEKPQHTVYVSSFYMARYPVTVEQFGVFVEMERYRTEVEDTKDGYVYDGKTWKTDPDAYWRRPRGRGSDIRTKANHPVTLVTARDTDRLAQWLANLANLPVRLPTEAEWDKTARGTDGRKYPWGSQAPTAQLCNFNNYKQDTTPVGDYSHWGGDSPYGCADMAGNVWERCADAYDSDVYKHRTATLVRDPFTYVAGNSRVLRGGAFGYSARFVRCASRDDWYYDHYDYVGVRLAVSPVSLHTSGR